jgi:hypothetical protein
VGAARALRLVGHADALGVLLDVSLAIMTERQGRWE